jgi:hypothetical protein
MVSSAMLRRVDLVRTDVSEELHQDDKNRFTGTQLAVTKVPSSPILVTLMKDALSFPETSVLTGATRRNIPEDGILHSHLHEDL